MSDTLPPLPEPAGFRTRYRSEPGMIGHYPWTYADQGRRRIDRPECEYENLFTADQMREYAAAALAAAAAVAEPVAIHQWRKRLCCNWYDGHPDHSDGGGPYETRTLYAAPPRREPLTDERMHELRVELGIGASPMFMNIIMLYGRAIERAHGISAPKEQP